MVFPVSSFFSNRSPFDASFSFLFVTICSDCTNNNVDDDDDAALYGRRTDVVSQLYDDERR